MGFRLHGALLLGVSFLLLTPENATSCTTFALKHPEVKGALLAKSYDWPRSLDHGYLVINPKGVEKRGSLTYAEGDQASAPWVSKYGSVTFNQFGREFPNGGMNEAGLAIEVLVLRSTEHLSAEQRPTRPSFNESQWLQYQLDNFGTVREVLANVEEARVSQLFVGLHYSMCDAEGECAVVEFLDGRPVVHASPESIAALNGLLLKTDLGVFDPPVVSNKEYGECRARLDVYDSLSEEATKNPHSPIPARKKKEMIRSTSSYSRFLNGANASREFREMEWGEVTNEVRTAQVEYAFESLYKVLKTVFFDSIWHIVYDTANRVIYFKSQVTSSVPHDRGEPAIRFIRLSDLEEAGRFNCVRNAAYGFDFNVNYDVPGDATPEFQLFSSLENVELMAKNPTSIFFGFYTLPVEAYRAAASYAFGPERKVFCPLSEKDRQRELERGCPPGMRDCIF